jgi:hypothetical protein
MTRWLIRYAMADAIYHVAVKRRLRRSLGIEGKPQTTISYDSRGRVNWAH